MSAETPTDRTLGGAGARDAGTRVTGRRAAPLASRIWSFLTRPRGNRLWDGVVRGTGVLGLLGILLVTFVPGAGPLVGLGIYTIWISGPLSPFFPVGLEPVLMLFGRLYLPLLVAGVSTAAALYVEFFNFHLYDRLLRLQAARGFRESRLVRFLRRLFDGAPFLTVWVCSLTPLPFWAVRILAALSGYPLARYLGAAFLGRLPKYWFFAALGLYWRLSAPLLLGIALGGSVLIGLAPWALRRWRRGGGRAPTPEFAAAPRGRPEARDPEAASGGR